MKKQRVLAIGVAAGLVACSVTASAGSVLRVNGSRAMPLSSAPLAINYYHHAPDPAIPGDYDRYVADVELDGFMFCNHVDDGLVPAGSPMTVVARHGAWSIHNLGSQDAGGSVSPALGIQGLSYNGGTLSLSADDYTQCYVADAQGLGVAEINSLYADGFDTDAISDGGNVSAVRIVVDHLPANSDDTFRYRIIVSLSPLAAAQAQGDMQTYSLQSSDFYLNESYNSALFSSCGTVPGQAITEDTTLLRSCIVRPGVDLTTLSGSVPVVAASLFTTPASGESSFGDNVAFGYPYVTP
ncbi:MAG TPA: hypothetical protein VFG73_01515 [Rhodanobacteraceae bacterium]|nr:hypothetical protein [Rhodanobacteraceae bacterium]